MVAKKAIKVPEPAKLSEDKCGNTKCGKPVVKTGIECDSCKKWFHRICSKLDKSAFDLYNDKDFLLWYCTSCRSLLDKAIKALEKEKETATIAVQTDGSQKSEADEGVPEDVSINLREKKTNRTATKYSDKNTLNNGKEDNLPKDILNVVLQRLEEQQNVLNQLVRDKHGMKREMGTLKKCSEIATGRYRNVVVHGIPEPRIKESAQRRRAVTYHVRNWVRLAGFTEQVTLKRVIRLGKWREEQKEELRKPRPTLVEFANPRQRDRFLAAAGEIRKLSNGRVVVEPDGVWKEPVSNKAESGELVISIPKILDQQEKLAVDSTTQGAGSPEHSRGTPQAKNVGSSRA